jgi:hypothetical protein
MIGIKSGPSAKILSINSMLLPRSPTHRRFVGQTRIPLLVSCPACKSDYRNRPKGEGA